MVFDDFRKKAEAALVDAADAEPNWQPLPWCPEQFPSARMKTREETDRWLVAVNRRHENASIREPELADFVLAVISAFNEADDVWDDEDPAIACLQWLRGSIKRKLEKTE